MTPQGLAGWLYQTVAATFAARRAKGGPFHHTTSDENDWMERYPLICEAVAAIPARSVVIDGMHKTIELPSP